MSEIGPRSLAKFLLGIIWRLRYASSIKGDAGWSAEFGVRRIGFEIQLHFFYV